MAQDRIEPDDYWGFLGSPQTILEASQRPRRAPVREAGVVWARDRAELDMHVVALGQQGHRIVAALPDSEGCGYQVVWQEWG